MTKKKLLISLKDVISSRAFMVLTTFLFWKWRICRSRTFMSSCTEISHCPNFRANLYNRINKNHFVNFTGATFVNHLHRQHLLIVNQVHLISSSETQGQIKGARESLKGWKNIYETKKNIERREEPLGAISYQTSSKRSPPFWLLIGARKLVFFKTT